MKCLSHTTIKRFYRTLLYGENSGILISPTLTKSTVLSRINTAKNRHVSMIRFIGFIPPTITFKQIVSLILCCCQLCIWRSMWETPWGMLFPVFLKLCLCPSLWTTLQQSHHHWQTQQNISGGSCLPCLPEGVGCAGALPLGPSTKQRSHQLLEHVS